VAFWQILILVVLVLVNLFFLLTLIGGLLGASFGSPFVPSGKKIIAKMVKMAQIKPGEKVFDLGCGDGRILFEAEKAGGNCVGVEIAPPIFLIAKLRKFLKKSKAKIRLGNLFSQKDLKTADVVFLFLMPPVVEKFYREIWPKLKPGARVVSHAFEMKKLPPTEKISRKESGHAPIYLFVKN